ncbi:MAG: sigma-70 family RNA polymerase sigma factor [Bacillota bacterium]|nr:sigma-70 family RNA polymerase sigma factor [Bacillota bacterium]
MVSEKELLRLAQEGQVAAFEELIARHQLKVYHLALRLTGDAEDAADMAQEAFLKAFLSLPTFRGDASFGTWLHRITTNVCLDEYRRRQRRPKVVDVRPHEGELDEVDWPDPQPGPETLVLRKEHRQELERALLSLPDEFRVPLVLRDVEGMSYGFIAQTLQIPEGTVKSRLHRARLALRRALQAELSSRMPVQEGERQVE